MAIQISQNKYVSGGGKSQGKEEVGYVIRNEEQIGGA